MRWRTTATAIFTAVASAVTGTAQARQLALKLTLDEEATLENFFCTAATRPVCHSLRIDLAEPVLFLHGSTGAGKTHLLQAACHEAQPGSLYLPLSELQELDPHALLQDLEQAPRIAIDDLHRVAGQAAWEEALFHLMNRCRASGAQILFSSLLPPGELPIALADLQSRLAGGLIWAMAAYSDDDVRSILAFRASRRGLNLSPAVLDYLGTRVSRSLSDLLKLLERLDEAALQAQRPLTVPLIREVLGAARGSAG